MLIQILSHCFQHQTFHKIFLSLNYYLLFYTHMKDYIKINFLEIHGELQGEILSGAYVYVPMRLKGNFSPKIPMRSCLN